MVILPEQYPAVGENFTNHNRESTGELTRLHRVVSTESADRGNTNSQQVGRVPDREGKGAYMMKSSAILALAAMGILVMGVGCASDDVRNEREREADRAVLRLTEIEAERDQYRTEAEELQSKLVAAEKNAADAQAKLKTTEEELAKLRAEQARAQAAAADVERLQKQLEETRKELQAAQDQVATLQQENAELQKKVTAAVPATQPNLNK